MNRDCEEWHYFLEKLNKQEGT